MISNNFKCYKGNNIEQPTLRRNLVCRMFTKEGAGDQHLCMGGEGTRVGRARSHTAKQAQ